MGWSKFTEEEKSKIVNQLLEKGEFEREKKKKEREVIKFLINQATGGKKIVLKFTKDGLDELNRLASLKVAYD